MINESRFKDLILRFQHDRMTMIQPYGFTSIMEHRDKIKALPGDIVECGVWRGGMSIFLSKLFTDKILWCCDSFEGCQNPLEGKYFYPLETHGLGLYAVFLEEVIYNFEKYNMLFSDIPSNLNNVMFLKGWVRDTLSPDKCQIKDISLLRVDVDSYSATLETLDYLYDKVVSGGMIVYDDSALDEGWAALKTFFKDREVPKMYDPQTGDEVNIYSDVKPPCAIYSFKI